MSKRSSSNPEPTAETLPRSHRGRTSPITLVSDSVDGGSAPRAAIEVPAWALALASAEREEPVDVTATLTSWSSRSASGDLVLLSYRWRDAVLLEATAFEEACLEIYRRMAAELSTERARYPIRLWNFVPGILSPLGDHEHRYMAFNAGRYRALREWLGDNGLPSQVATASGVGHFDQDLFVHCLASVDAGRPVENPRQTPAYRYSPRYGLVPPCFARATLWHQHGQANPSLLVGGTASVRGEDSFHGDDLRRQLDETFYNLAALVRTAEGTPCAHLSPEEVRWLMQRYCDFRVYLVAPEMKGAISERLGRLARKDASIEYVHVDLCRPELLVEIEGVVDSIQP